LRGQELLAVRYEGIKLDCGYRLDIVVEDRIILSKIYPQRPLRLCGELFL
jgi:hypothetical protein